MTDDHNELLRAASLLALAVTSASALSACKNEPTAAQVTPVVERASSAADAATSAATRDENDPPSIDELRRAAEVVAQWQRRSPDETQRVLSEKGLFACDSATSACIAARAGFTAAAAAPAAPTVAAHAPTPARLEGRSAGAPSGRA
jgi:hypothetical protein